MPSGDPSLPDATTAFAAPAAGEEAKATHDTIAVQQQSSPQEKMTKADESKSMPQPGQANDHSTIALDKDKGG